MLTRVIWKHFRCAHGTQYVIHPHFLIICLWLLLLSLLIERLCGKTVVLSHLSFIFTKQACHSTKKCSWKFCITGSYYPKMIYLWFIGGSTKFNITQVLEFQNSRNVSTLNVSIEISKYKLKYKYSIK